MPTPTIRLNNGVEIPQLGYGVFKVPNDETEAAVLAALDAGYRLIDTAAIYGNEAGVGAALAKTSIPRDEIFVTSKVWNADQGYNSTLAAFEISMTKLGLDVLDLYLIHWPTPARNLFPETWRALEKLHADGRIRAIGVSNFRIEDLQVLLNDFDVVPAVNQVELHPTFSQPELRAFHAEHGIATEAWGPLGQGKDLHDTVINEIADRRHKTPAQVILRWHNQIGTIAIPKSIDPERIAANLNIFDFELDSSDLDALNALDTGVRGGGDPSVFGND
jgi:diketogulonate reductase-like aldo/keto reductase